MTFKRRTRQLLAAVSGSGMQLAGWLIASGEVPPKTAKFKGQASPLPRGGMSLLRLTPFVIPIRRG
jgi:hypothetical protein